MRRRGAEVGDIEHELQLVRMMSEWEVPSLYHLNYNNIRTSSEKMDIGVRSEGWVVLGVWCGFVKLISISWENE